MASGARESSGWLRRLLPLIALVGVGALVISQGWHAYLTLEHLAANRDSLAGAIEANLPFALLGFIAIYIAVVALSLPGGALMTVTGGFLFGWVLGGLASVVGATIGAAIIFLIAKTSLGEPLAARAGPWLAKLRDGFQQDALSYLLFLRLVPAFPFWLVNLAPALLGVPLSTYLIGTAAGIVPGTFAFAYAGVGLDSVIEAQRHAHQACLQEAGVQGAATCQFSLDPSALVTPQLLIAFALLGLVALIPVVLKKFRSRPAG
jgi:uncharacterized membrane protein YdjX (TVP38/TMEM64 family)